MQCMSEDLYVILVQLYIKFSVITWLNDYEYMKQVVPTYFLFH